MAQPTKAAIKRYMRQVVDSHVDTTDEVNMTQLAEDALCNFSDYDDEETFFEVAYDVAKWYEQTRKR